MSKALSATSNKNLAVQTFLSSVPKTSSDVNNVAAAQHVMTPLRKQISRHCRNKPPSCDVLLHRDSTNADSPAFPADRVRRVSPYLLIKLVKLEGTLPPIASSVCSSTTPLAL